ncbi:hypothetical protein TNCV_4056431 [Trichonephila clavipes]|nr:hypothetical protein TNCV_4056431 [Trichonephila clavipes]
MSEQRNLPESMAWRVIGRLESGQTHNVVSRTLLGRQKCCCKDVESIQSVRCRPGAGRPRATTSSYDRYIQLTARRNRTEGYAGAGCIGNRTGCVAKQHVNFMRRGSIRPMVCIPLCAARKWAAEHRIGNI